MVSIDQKLLKILTTVQYVKLYSKIIPRVIELDGNNLFALNYENYETDQNAPLHIHDNVAELLYNIKLLNQDVDTITTDGPYFSDEDSFRNYCLPRIADLDKTPTISFLIKDMNLNSNLFFKDSSKLIPSLTITRIFKKTFSQKVLLLHQCLTLYPRKSCYSSVHWLIKCREMIHYLVKRLQVEEKQRLRTEIQASRMISSMEKLLKQMVSLKKTSSNF